ncbi:hypothetical protein [Streptomyces kronopolitis]|uniref:hypothetical protein n=1 Tax=Streptomyces kronopolitis TaxID=1612435 RepID=UPI003D97E5F2
MNDDDTLSHFEYDTKPFTTTELAAIMDYRKAIDGIPEAITETDRAALDTVTKAFGSEAFRSLAADHCDALNTWYLALDQALAELLTCTTESTTYSTAAARFLKAAAEEYHPGSAPLRAHADSLPPRPGHQPSHRELPSGHQHPEPVDAGPGRPGVS